MATEGAGTGTAPTTTGAPGAPASTTGAPAGGTPPAVTPPVTPPAAPAGAPAAGGQPPTAGAPGAGGADKAGASGGPVGQQPPAPVDYRFTFPDGFTPDAATVETFTGLAKSN